TGRVQDGPPGSDRHGLGVELAEHVAHPVVIDQVVNVRAHHRAPFLPSARRSSSILKSLRVRTTSRWLARPFPAPAVTMTAGTSPSPAFRTACVMASVSQFGRVSRLLCSTLRTPPPAVQR